jgi:hypothetical protein
VCRFSRLYCLFIDHLLKTLIGVVVHGVAVKDGYVGLAAATSKDGVGTEYGHSRVHSCPVKAGIDISSDAVSRKVGLPMDADTSALGPGELSQARSRVCRTVYMCLTSSKHLAFSLLVDDYPFNVVWNGHKVPKNSGQVFETED